MASPFPGMDPYLEPHWGDVHHSLITYARDQLRTVLPRDLRARVEERVSVESATEKTREIVPDLRIVQRRRERRPAQSGPRGLVVADPVIVQLDDPATEGYIQIVDISSGHRLVTVLEFLSLTNKLAGEGQVKYLQKRRELMGACVNLVEIDLLRSGQRLLPVPWHKVPESCRTTYHARVWRASSPLCLEIYGMPLAAHLPAIRIPLRASDPDVVLDLQALVTECYRNGDYEDDLDYEQQPDPPLESADARWADTLLRKAGKRTRPKIRRANRRNGS